MARPQKKLNNLPSNVKSKVSALKDVAMVNKLSDYELQHIFSFLDVPDKVNAAQVCRQWKDTIYQVSLWRRDEGLGIKETADIGVMAPSLVKRGITEVRFYGVTDKGSNAPSLLFLNQQLCNLTTIMATSLTVLDLCNMNRTVNYRVLQRVFSTPLPNLDALILGDGCQVRMETLGNIIINCSNLSKISIPDCRHITNAGFLALAMNLSKLKVIYLGHSRITLPVVRDLFEILPELKELMILISYN